MLLMADISPCIKTMNMRSVSNCTLNSKFKVHG